MPAVSGQAQPQAVHLSVGWEIALATSFVIVIIAVSTVAIYQFCRDEPDLRGIELENGARSDTNWPASMSNKRKRRRKKTRKKTRKRDPNLTINSESEEIEVVESFEEDTASLPIDGVGTGGGSGSGQQHVDIPKPTRCRSNSSTILSQYK